MDRKGLKCTALHSEAGDMHATSLDDCDLICTSPEYALTHLRQNLSPALRKNIALIAFDEAHCLTEWGQGSFRPEYAHLAELLSILPEAAVLVTTETMTSDMRRETIKSLCICDYKTVAQNPNRPEIYISMGKPEMESLQWLIDDLLEKGGQSDKTIIYCCTSSE